MEAWAIVGLIGQGIFSSRFLVQWAASERKGETVVPESFWWISLAGGLVTLPYAVHLGSLPFSLTQGMGLVLYGRNLMIARSRSRPATSGIVRGPRRMAARGRVAAGPSGREAE